MDGFDKTGGCGPTPRPHRLHRATERALVASWTVLRFTNRQFSREPDDLHQHLEMTVRDMLRVQHSLGRRSSLPAGTRVGDRVKKKPRAGAGTADVRGQQKDLEALLASTSVGSSRLIREQHMGKALLAVAILVATAAYTPFNQW